MVEVLGLVGEAALLQNLEGGVAPAGRGDAAERGAEIELGEVPAAEVVGEIRGGEGGGAVAGDQEVGGRRGGSRLSSP